MWRYCENFEISALWKNWTSKEIKVWNQKNLCVEQLSLFIKNSSGCKACRFHNSRWIAHDCLTTELWAKVLQVFSMFLTAQNSSAFSPGLAFKLSFGPSSFKRSFSALVQCQFTEFSEFSSLVSESLSQNASSRSYSWTTAATWENKSFNTLGILQFHSHDVELFDKWSRIDTAIPCTGHIYYFFSQTPLDQNMHLRQERLKASWPCCGPVAQLAFWRGRQTGKKTSVEMGVSFKKNEERAFKRGDSWSKRRLASCEMLWPWQRHQLWKDGIHLRISVLLLNLHDFSISFFKIAWWKR